MIRCNRCNKNFSAPVKCERSDCELPGSFEAMRQSFPHAVPAKYYCSVVGGRDSGKTYYLLSLVHELLKPSQPTKNLLRRLGITSIKMIDPSSNDLFEQLVGFCKNGELLGTDISIPLGFFSILLTREDNRTYEIVLFNSSGEKNEDELRLRKFNTTAHEMKGTFSLCFIDPRSDSGLNRILDLPKQGNISDLNFTEYIHGVYQHDANGVQYVNTPLAICISKFDLLLHRRPLDIPMYPFIEAGNQRFFPEIDNISRRLKLFLQNNSRTIDPAELDTMFSRISYFAVAPFGSDEKPYWDERKPKGILAPFIWMLKAQKIIQDEYRQYL